MLPPEWDREPDDRGRARQAAGPGRRLAMGIVRQVLLDPIRNGRLGWSTMPSTLRAVTALALGCIALQMMIIATSRWLVRLPLTTTIYGASFPVGLVYPLAVSMIIGLALIYTASLQMHTMLRWSGWLVISLLLFLGSAGLIWQIRGLVIMPAGASVALALLSARRRLRFRLWELVVAIGVIGGCWCLVWLTNQFLQPGIATSLVTAMVAFLQPFVVPLAVVAGLALAEIAVALAHGTIQATQQQLPRVAWSPIMVGLALAALVVNSREDTGWGELGWSSVVVATGLLGWWGLGVLARHRTPAPGVNAAAYDPELLWDRFRNQVWLIAVAICLPFFVSGLLTILGVVVPAFLGAGVADRLLAVNGRLLAAGLPLQFALVSLGALIGSGWFARRGEVPRAQVCWLVAVVAAVLALDRLRMPYVSGWTGPGLCLVLVVVTVAVVAWLRLRGRFTSTPAAACCAVLAICLLYPLRYGLADPLTALVGTGVASVLLLSSAWQLLTEGAVTRGHSAAVPRVGRLLFFLGYQLLWVLSAACLVISRDQRFADLAVGIEIGDQLLGTTLLLGASTALLTMAMIASGARPAVPRSPTPGTDPRSSASR